MTETKYSNYYPGRNVPHDLGFRSYHRNDCGWPSCCRSSTHFHCGTCGFGTSQVSNVIAHRRVCMAPADVQLSSDALLQHEVLPSTTPFAYYPAVTPTSTVGLPPHTVGQGTTTSKMMSTQQSAMFNFVLPSQSSQYGGFYGTQPVFPSPNLFSPSGFNGFGQLDSPWLSQSRLIPTGTSAATPTTQITADAINRSHYDKGESCCGKASESTAIGMCSPLTAEAFKVVTKELQSKIDTQNWYGSTQGFNHQPPSCKYSDPTAPQPPPPPPPPTTTTTTLLQCSAGLLLEHNDLKAEECIDGFTGFGETGKGFAGKAGDGKPAVENADLESESTSSSSSAASSPSENTDIVVEESESEVAAANLRCLVCNKSAPLLSVNDFTALNQEMPLTQTTHVSVLGKLSQVIDDENFRKLKDCSICPRCLNLVNVVDRLEIKLKSAKDELIDMYRSKERAEKRDGNAGADDGKSCHICDRTFSSASYLEKHKQCHTKVYSYYCEYCGKGFAILRKLENHLLLHSDSSRFQCEMCGKRFAHKHTLLDHIKQHRGEFRFRCGVCHKGFVRKSVYKVHLQIHGDESLICHACGRQFKNAANLSVHVKHCTGDLKHGCDKCDKKFPLKSLLAKHVSLVHDARYDYVCTICRKGFGKNSDLKNHMRSHSDVKPFHCTKCNNSYKSLSNLNQHLKVHSTTTALECNICNKQFTRKDSLKDHLNQHTGNKPYKCATCWKTFANRINFNSHAKRHNGTLKQTPCPVCGKLFAKGLKDHMTSHSGQKPYSCKHCLAVFTVKSSLNKHVRTKHVLQANKIK